MPLLPKGGGRGLSNNDCPGISTRQRLLHGTQNYALYVLPKNVEIAHTRGPSPFAAGPGSAAVTLPDADTARRATQAPVRWRRLAYALNLVGIFALGAALFRLPMSDLLSFTAEPMLSQLIPLLVSVIADPWLQLALALIVPGVLLSRCAQRRLRRHTRAAWREVLLRARLLP